MNEVLVIVDEVDASDWGPPEGDVPTSRESLRMRYRGNDWLYRENQREYGREYRKTPQYRKYKREYEKTPQRHKYMREYQREYRAAKRAAGLCSVKGCTCPTTHSLCAGHSITSGTLHKNRWAHVAFVGAG